LEAFPKKCLNINQRHFINLPPKSFPALAKLSPKAFPALCQNCLQKLFQHLPKLLPETFLALLKNASKNYAGICQTASVENIPGTFKNCRKILFPTRVNAALFILSLKDFTGSLLAFAGTLKCR
jgi:hypothetical protein